MDLQTLLQSRNVTKFEELDQSISFTIDGYDVLISSASSITTTVTDTNSTQLYCGLSLPEIEEAIKLNLIVMLVTSSGVVKLHKNYSEQIVLNVYDINLTTFELVLNEGPIEYNTLEEALTAITNLHPAIITETTGTIQWNADTITTIMSAVVPSVEAAVIAINHRIDGALYCYFITERKSNSNSYMLRLTSNRSLLHQEALPLVNPAINAVERTDLYTTLKNLS